jgi:hypothetical protein
MNQPDPATDFTSIGQVACLLRRTVRSIETAADELLLSPAVRFNGIPYFDAPAVEILREHFADKPAEGWSKDPIIRRRLLHPRTNTKENKP